jgi:hypothetical protein
MAHIAAIEEADVTRDEEDVSSAEEQAALSAEGDAHIRDPSRSASKLVRCRTPRRLDHIYLSPC